ncbi:olfactory receptor 8A1-like [Alosa pseudoharengus]|uniref:olfactory receptor 8A1-like n=1 Tax=Alosa pseudoharengus TaxID=34774 RepID=UPI003F8A8DEE
MLIVADYEHPFMEAVFPDGNSNPIEHLWDVLDKQVRSMKAPPHNLQDLKDLLLLSWYQIPQHSFRGLVESMPRRGSVYNPMYFLLVFILYILIITVNLTLILTVIMEKSLHEPMYIFLSNLCLNSLYGTVGFYPKFLLDLQSDTHTITYTLCLIQSYVIYTSVVCEITNITVMSYDRYVAICRPLQYHSILTPHAVLKLLVVAWAYPLLATATALVLTVCISSNEGRTKFTKTCLPHILVLAIFIITAVFDILYGWEGSENLSVSVRNALAIQFLIFPPLLNPIIYGLQLPQIRKATQSATERPKKTQYKDRQDHYEQ